jgi:long-chain acyl-CoA synthetase
VLFQEAIMRPLIWLLAAPAVSRESGLRLPQQPLLLIANHVTAFDAPLVLYALPAPMRRRVAIAMAGEMLDDWRHARNQGNWLRNLLAPLEYCLVTALFNVFPLPRAAGFRRSFAHAGEAMDRGYHVLVFPEGQQSEDGALQPFRAGIGLLASESKAQILPVALQGLGELKQRKRPWFRAHIQIRVGQPITPGTQLPPGNLAELLHHALAELLQGNR